MEPTAQDRILIYGVNWLGDSIMAMPALQLWRARNPHHHITLLTKAALAPLWHLHEGVDEIIELAPRRAGTRQAIEALRAIPFKEVYIFPNSFRSAWIPWKADIPRRTGQPGHFRSWMLTRCIRPEKRPTYTHQAWEYFRILGLELPPELPEPRLFIPPSLQKLLERRIAEIPTQDAWIALIPGAARGPSKQWPPERFADVARRLTMKYRCRVLVLGTEAEYPLCAATANAIGGRATNMAGATSLRDLAVLLSLCRLTLCNDSGGMHLSSAVGTPVVAVFGMTDPSKTGPLGYGHQVIASGLAGVSRKIRRSSQKATAALAGIATDRVYEAAAGIMEQPVAPAQRDADAG